MDIWGAWATGYGVVCDESGNVNQAATEKLRADLSSKRPDELPVFNSGPPMDEILANALAETGLEAPKKPVPLW